MRGISSPQPPLLLIHNARIRYRVTQIQPPLTIIPPMTILDLYPEGTIPMKEIIFLIEESPEGGYTARAPGHAIFTEADTFKELKAQVRDAIRCHFGYEDIPPLICLHHVKEEVIPA